MHMLKPWPSNVTDINQFHWCLSWGWRAFEGTEKAATADHLARMSPRDRVHYEEGQRRAAEAAAQATA